MNHDDEPRRGLLFTISRRGALLSVCAGAAAFLGAVVSALAADTTPPDPVDIYQIAVVLPSPGAISVSGSPGALEPLGSVRIVNDATGGDMTAAAADDGSFLVQVAGGQGDRLWLYSLDAAGNASSATVVYAGGLTIKNPYTTGGFWHVGQAHMHTTNSDGVNSPAAMEAAYFDAGYDFVISTDHRGYLPDFTADDDGMTPDPDNSATGKDLVWIPASEIGNGSVHMGAWGTASAVPVGSLVGTQNAIDAVRGLGGIVVMNHPENNDGALSWEWYEDIAASRGSSLVEAFNGNTAPGSGSGLHIRDAADLADEFQQVWWIGTDDAHDLEPDRFDRYAMIVQTDSAQPTAGDLLAAADSGRHYIRETRAGPELIAVAVVGNDITVTLRDVASPYDVTWLQRGGQIAEQDLAVDTSASYTVRGSEGYVRAEIKRVSDGTRAYTQPLFVANSRDLTTSASAAALMDDDADTMWDAGSPSGAFILDVGQLRNLNVIRIDWDGQNGRRFNYRIEASATGEFSGEEKEVVRQPYSNRLARTLDFFDAHARYLRVVITGQSAGSPATARVREVEVMDASPAATHLYLNNVSGSDTETGLLGKPWRTFNHARENVRPRDILHIVNTGSPYGPLILFEKNSGKHPGAIVTYQGDLTGLTPINAGGLDYGLKLKNTRYLEIMHLDVYGAVGANIAVQNAGDGTVLRNNRIHDASGRGVLGSGKFTLAYNLIYRNGTDGVLAYIDDTNATIYNNVLYGNGWVGLMLGSGSNVSATIRNNIASANAQAAFRRDTNTTVVDSHNCVAGVYVGNWAKTGSIAGDPQLMDPTADNFTLQMSSPCIDAGIDLGLSADFAGKPIMDMPGIANRGSNGAYTRNYVDIGAFEAQVVCQVCEVGCH